MKMRIISLVSLLVLFTAVLSACAMVEPTQAVVSTTIPTSTPTAIPYGTNLGYDYTIIYTLNGSTLCGKHTLENSVGDIIRTESGWDINNPKIGPAIQSRENAFTEVKNNIAKFTSVGVFPPFVHIEREGPDIEKMNELEGSGTPSKSKLKEVNFKIVLGGKNKQGYQTKVIDGGDTFYVTYTTPATATTKASGRYPSFQISIPKNILWNAVCAPFLTENYQGFNVNTAQIQEPVIAQNETEVLRSLLYSIGSRGGTIKIAEILLHPKDANSVAYEAEFSKLLYAYVDLLASYQNRPIIVTLMGQSENNLITRGFLTGSGGGGSGNISGDITAKAWRVFMLGKGDLDGTLKGEMSQDPIEINGQLNSFSVTEYRIFIYFENP